MAGYYNRHLSNTGYPSTTQISKSRIGRGMIIRIKYRKGTQTKKYLVFVLEPKWPKTIEGKLHGLSLDIIEPQKLLLIGKNYDEVISDNPKVKKLNLPKIQIDESSKVFYTKQIKNIPELKDGYRTFNWEDIQTVEVLNYNWGKYDAVDDKSERRRKIEEEARIRKEQDDALKGI